MGELDRVVRPFASKSGGRPAVLLLALIPWVY